MASEASASSPDIPVVTTGAPAPAVPVDTWSAVLESFVARVEADGSAIPDDYCTYYLCTQVNGFYVTNIKIGICEYNSSADCGPGQEFVKNKGECCGRCKQTQCVVISANGAVILLMEEQTIPSPDDKCISYTCMISMGNLNAVKEKERCEHQSQSDCGIGYQYQIPSDQCCGKCVPTSCVYKTPDGNTILLDESENWKSDDSCTTVTCQKIDGQFFSSSATETCTYTSANDCGLGYIYQTVPNQCCGNCVQGSCVFTTANGVLTTLEDGQTLPEPSDICIVYNCKKTNEQFSTLVLNKKCEHESAQDCQAGEEYQKVPDQCCGQCVQTQCLIIDADGTSKTLTVGETWTSTSNACISYGCTKSNRQIYSTLMNKTCESLTPQECESVSHVELFML
ncbi:mucin-2-like [Rana temporaria]|uniref:mucin-2-like n=1 Tax=Rana temporaria TaxID=8407 RepID=UPI001AAD65C5|nr:mucin-2-like [Rana temporaria]